MPQDPNLYGQPPPKRQRKAMDLSSSLSFSAQLGSLLSKPPTTSSSSTPAPATATKGRTRPSKTDDIFSGVKAKRKDGAKHDFDAPDGRRGSGNKLRLRSPTGTFESEREREAARLNMEEKARRYAAMKRGDYVPDTRSGSGTGDRDPLVDFDRKWAEKHLDQRPGGGSGGSSSADSSDNDEGDGHAEGNDTEVITYTDEFGRTRRGTRAQARRQEQRARAGLAAAADLEAMSARPAAPASGLIWGDVVQVEAFAAADEEAMEALARKRDRSATPPPETHYDAAREIRSRGTGFYAFTAGDEARRRAEMDALDRARAETERVRREREEQGRARKDEVERRRREIEGRRRDVAERRAKKLADSFLDGLGADLGGDPTAAAAADASSTGPDTAGAAAPDKDLSPRVGTEGDKPSHDPTGQQQAEEAPR
ncbi:hypothetical protein RB595_002565 [Gaeumannomyces hyphopodioides]